MMKRTRISQRMSQHIMLLKLTRTMAFLRRNTLTYRVDMFISQTNLFVNRKMKNILYPLFP